LSLFRSREPSSSTAIDEEHDRNLSGDHEPVLDGDEHEPTCIADEDEHHEDVDDTDTLWLSNELSSESEGSDMDERETSSTPTPPESFLPNGFGEPLYSGANISVCATYCAIMEFSCSARLPYSSTEKLLTLLQLLCPPDNKLPSSMYKLKQFFRSFSTEYQKIEICRGCGQELPADHTCPQETKKNIVIHLPIQSSLQALTQSEWRDRASECVNRVEGRWVGEWMRERM